MYKNYDDKTSVSVIKVINPERFRFNCPIVSDERHPLYDIVTDSLKSEWKICIT